MPSVESTLTPLLVSLDSTSTALLTNINDKLNYIYAAGVFVIALCAGVLVLFILWRSLSSWFEF